MVTDGSHVWESPVDVKNPQQIVEKKNDDKKDSNKWFFSNIIVFTNERDSKKNKTLKNLEDAIKGTGVELHVFVAEEVSYKATDKNIKISDFQNKYV